MAVSAGAGAPAAEAAGRRWTYGLNVVVSTFLAIALLVILVIASDRFRGEADLTRGGSNSLSPATRALVANLKQDVRITGFYTVLSEYQKFAQKRKDTVRDLLALYENAGHGKVVTQMIDPMKEATAVKDALKRLSEKPVYKNEAKPHEAALEKLGPLDKKLAELAQRNAKEMQALVDTQPALGRVREFQIVLSGLQRIGREVLGLEQDVEKLKQDEIPRYGRAVEAMRDNLTRIRTLLSEYSEWMVRDAVALPGIPTEAQNTFRMASERFKPVLDEVAALLKDSENLKAVKLEEAYETLTRSSQEPPILIETSDEARVLNLEEVWPQRDPRAPEPADGDTREFAGEQAITAAILALTQKEKTVVVFVRYGGEPLLKPDFSHMNPMMMTQLPRAACQQLGNLIEKANYTTQEWDLAAAKEAPKVENAKHTIYVVFPPEAPPQPNPMQPSPKAGITPQDKEILFRAIDQSGMAIFLAGWAGMTQGMFPSQRTYEYADYLKERWGINGRYDRLTLHFQPRTQRGENLWVWGQDSIFLTTPDVVEYTDHKLARVLKSQRTAFRAAAPLEIVTGPGKPADVTVEELMRVRRSEDAWAVSDLARLEEDGKKRQGTTRRPEDLPAPFPIGVVATRAAKEGGQPSRVIVFGSSDFASDPVAQAPEGIDFSTGKLVLAFPGNVDLFVNSLNWLIDPERVAIGPRRNDVPRLDKLVEGPVATFWRIFLVALWPAVALIVGGGVWLFRRR